MRFNRCRCNMACSCVSVSSGSPENRTQHYSVISRVWATSPRLPFQVGHERSRTARGGCRKQPTQLLLPKQVCYHLHLCPLVSSQNARIRTGDLQVPDLARSQASLRSDRVRAWGSRTQTLPGFVVPAPIRWTGHCVRKHRTQWAGRCSNPPLRLFRPALHRLSYQPQRKKARRLGDTGLFV